MNEMPLPRWLDFSVLAVFSVLALLRSVHAIRTLRARKGAAAPGNEPAVLRLLRIALFVAVVVSVTLFGYWITFGLFDWMGRLVLPFPSALRIGGGALALAGLAALHWTHLALGRHFAVELRIGADHQLVTGGPYRFSRHPMYASLILFFIGAGMLSAHALILGPCVVLGGVLAARTRFEERMLRGHFGAAYDAYIGRTPWLFPGL